jgi:hypothetical protein
LVRLEWQGRGEVVVAGVVWVEVVVVEERVEV